MAVQHVTARQQPGVVGKAKEIAEGGQDIHGGAGGVHGDGLGHAAAPEKPGALIAGNVLLRVVDARQLRVIVEALAHHGVGVVVRRHADHRVLQRPGLCQPVVEILQRQLHLQVGGNEGLHGGRGVGVCRLGLRLVAGGHGLAPAPVGVAADGHIVGVEGGAVVGVIGQVFVHRGLHHLQIGVGPGAVAVGLQLQAVAAAHVEIPQVGMGLVPLIVGVFVVVPGPAVVAQGTQLVTHGKGHIVPCAGVKADVAVYPGGNEARHGGVFASGGGLAPGGLVVVGEHKALMGHLV